VSARTAHTIIREHYGLNRPVTDAEVRAEIANLERRAERGMLDDVISGPLYYQLLVAGYCKDC
jgi:hypothetical protein